MTELYPGYHNNWGIGFQKIMVKSGNSTVTSIPRPKKKLVQEQLDIGIGKQQIIYSVF